MRQLALVLFAAIAALGTTLHPDEPPSSRQTPPRKPGNPVFDGWYADPEAAIFGNEYWIYPTYSAPYDQQLFFDAFSSTDLVNWTKHPRILDSSAVTWAKRAMWAPSIVEKDGKYFFFFGANDIQNEQEDRRRHRRRRRRPPAGPFKDHLGKPLIGDFHNGASRSTSSSSRTRTASTTSSTAAGGHCNIARLNDDFTGLVPFADGHHFKEITPKGYVEGPFMFIRNGSYYFMWSEGGWTGPNYSVAYAIADSLLRPLHASARYCKQDPAIATGAGHHSRHPRRRGRRILHRLPPPPAWAKRPQPPRRLHRPDAV